MTDAPVRESIVSALKESGYLMEQEVATQLETLGFSVWTNWAFRDVEEGKSRELDVRGVKQLANNDSASLGAFVEVLIECKNNTNPYVFISRPKGTVDNREAPYEFCFPIPEYEERKRIDAKSSHVQYKKGFFHLGFDRIHHAFTDSRKVVQFCQLYRKNKSWAVNHGGLYDAVFFPMAKAIKTRRKDITSLRGNWKYFWLLVPIVVLNGDIYCVDSSSPNPQPESVDYVTFTREIRAKAVDGTFAVNFVRQDQLSAFMNERVAPLTSRTIELVTREAGTVLKRSIPWEE